jgi:hypothetical protein
MVRHYDELMSRPVADVMTEASEGDSKWSSRMWWVTSWYVSDRQNGRCRFCSTTLCRYSKRVHRNEPRNSDRPRRTKSFSVTVHLEIRSELVRDL